MNFFMINNFKIGTLVFLPRLPAYGIIAHPVSWIKEAEREFLHKAIDFQKSNNSVVPILLLGDVLGSRFILTEGSKELQENIYVERWIYSNVGEDISLVPSLDLLESFISQALLFFSGGGVGYLERVKNDLVVLREYLDDLEKDTYSSKYRHLRTYKLFQKALPKTKIGEEVN